MTEQERLKSIKDNGGLHLKTFKPENITYDMCLAAVKDTGNAIEYVPDKFRTEEIYQEACKSNGLMLKTVPQKYLTKTICEDAVTSSGLALQFVPEIYKTPELCLKAVANAPEAYSYTPVDFITPGFVNEAAKQSSCETVDCLPTSLKTSQFYYDLVSRNPDFFWYIPRKSCSAKIGKAAIKSLGCNTAADAIRKRPTLLSRLHPSLYDHDSCLAFVTSEYFAQSHGNDKFGSPMSGLNSISDDENGRLYLAQQYSETYSLPDMMRWSDVSVPILELNGYYLKYSQPDIITEEMCRAAVKSNPHALKYVPDKFKTEEICMIAFEGEPFTLKYFPDELMSEELAMKAVKESGYLLEELPDLYKNHEVCLIAVSDEGHGQIEAVPADVLDKEICMAWLENSKIVIAPLDKIPKELWDYDILLAAVKLDGMELRKVPDNLIDYNMCLSAVKCDHRAAKFIPKKFFTEEIADCIVIQSDVDFDLIPKDILNEEICLKAIKHGSRYDGTVLDQIPDELKTQEMCDTAVDISIWSLDAVPEQFVTYDMLVKIANEAPGRLCDNFPQKFRNKETISKMIQDAPRAESELVKLIEE